MYGLAFRVVGIDRTHPLGDVVGHGDNERGGIIQFLAQSCLVVDEVVVQVIDYLCTGLPFHLERKGGTVLNDNEIEGLPLQSFQYLMKEKLYIIMVVAVGVCMLE